MLMSIVRKLRLAARRFHPLRNFMNRSRLALFAVTLIAFGMALGGLDTSTGDEVGAFTEVELLSLPERQVPPSEILIGSPEASQVAALAAWEQVQVSRGETLDAIFRAQGFSIGLLHRILNLDQHTSKLTRIRPGETFAFRRNDDGTLQSMRYALDEGRYLLVHNDSQGLRSELIERQVSTQMFEARGVIDSSLFLAGKRAGLSDAMVMKLANIFGWDIDFVLDIRSGDRFYLLYEKIYRDGEYLRDGEVLAATFINQGEKFQAIRFEADNGPQYYAPDGRHMRKAFLRAPLNFSYISSNFNPKRFHPILRRVKAHNGIDYRAPQGTPVYAAGDGRVIKSAYDQYNGHHVFLQHANSIVTKYLHFTKRTVNKGDRVRQGQVIGYVGATGLAEAPHLHYEFVVNGVHRNPRTVSLPTVKPLEAHYLAAFRNHAAPYLNQLSRLEAASLYAGTE
ncbi:MAG: peptidoglycan DD-metalloendopeptidase family protein [Xanthomonadales bacterium]|nr:peptidoglycan DD-metalloendopeptidase family protein [Xanthomonadales bacterium]